MYSSWIPQNIQKRLLLYILQQLSFFSEVDLPNLEEVSLNNIHLRSVSIDPEKFDKIPGFRLRHGNIRDFILSGGVVDGVNVDISGVDLVVAPSFDNIKQDLKDVESSLAQSTAELSQVIIDESIVDDDNGGNTFDGNSGPQMEHAKTPPKVPSNRESLHSEGHRKSSFSSGVMTKALDMALLRIRVSIKDVKIKIVVESTNVEFSIDKISFESKNGLRSLSFLGISASTLQSHVNPGNSGSDSSPDSNSSASSDSEPSLESGSDSEDAELLESRMFSKEEASSIYMSAFSLHLDKPTVSEPSSSLNRVLLFFIDKVDAELKNLYPLSDLRLDVGSINIAAVPLMPTLTTILNSLSKAVKLKNHQLRKANFANRPPKDKFEPVVNDTIYDAHLDGSHQVFDSIKIKRISIGMTSSLTFRGNFASTKDDLELVFKNLTIKQKGSILIYGGVETLMGLKYSNGIESRFFHFQDIISEDSSAVLSAPNTPKAEVRFEYSALKANDQNPTQAATTELTILLHKPGRLELDASSLRHLINLSIDLNLLNEDLSILIRDTRLMSELANDSTNTTKWKDPGKMNSREEKVKDNSQILLQTAVLDVTLNLLESTKLKITIFPISFDKARDHLFIHRVASSYIADSKEMEVMTIPQISLRIQSKDFPTYKFSASKEIPEKTTLTGALSIQAGEITISMEHSNFMALIADISTFATALQLRHDRINDVKNASFDNQRNSMKSLIMNAGRSIRGSSGHVKFGEHKVPRAKLTISLKLIHVKLRNIFNALGNLDIKLLEIKLYKLNSGVLGLVSLVGINHVMNNSMESMVSSCLDDDYPMIQFSLSESRRAPEIVFRCFQIDYYTKWIQVIQDFRQEGQKNDLSNDLSSVSHFAHESEGQNESQEPQVKAENSRTDAGKFELHCTSHNLMLNISPLRLPSQLSCAITKGVIYLTTSRGNISLKHTFRDVNVLLIDEKSKYRVPELGTHSSFISQRISGGYTLIGVISALHLGLNILQSPSNVSSFNPKNETSTLDVKVNVDNVRTSVCADSCHTLVQTVSDLKVPVVFKEEDRFKVKVDPDFHWPENILEEIQAFGMDHTAGNKCNAPLKNEGKATHHGTAAEAIQLRFIDEYCDSAKSQSSSPNIKSESETASDEAQVSDVSSIEFAESHFYQKEQDTQVTPISLMFKLNISEIEIYLHDGYDWKSTRISLAESIKSLKNRTKELRHKSREREISKESSGSLRSLPDTASPDQSTKLNGEDAYSEITDTLFKSIHISTDMNSDETNLVELINCQLQGEVAKEAHTNVDVKGRTKDLKLKRSQTHKAKIEVKNLNADFTNYTSRDPRFDATPQGLTVEVLNKVEFMIEDLTIFDNVATSSWNKFLTYMSILGDREFGTNMLKLVMTNVRPDARLAFAEASIKLKVLPLRLYIDQDTLAFLTRFFEFKDTRFAQPVEEPVYIQKLEIDALRMKFDYKPKKIDFNGIRAGRNVELINIFALDGSDLSLKKAVVYGVHGYSKIGEALGQIYAPHIRKSQIYGLLSGLPPVRTIFNFKDGVKDLVSIPLEEYKRDRRLFYGLQKGTKSFAKITTSEILRLGMKIASGTQVMLENLEEYFGGEGTAARMNGRAQREKKTASFKTKRNGKRNLLETSQILKNSVLDDDEQKLRPRRYLQASIVEEENIDVDSASGELSSTSLSRDLGNLQRSTLMGEELDALSDDSCDYDERPEEETRRKVVSLYSKQPVTPGEGFKSAYASLGKNLSKTKRMIVDLKDELRDANSYQDQLASIAKSSPVIIIRPIIGTTEAVMKTLMGVSNGIDSRLLIENLDKYRLGDLDHEP